MSKYDDVKLVKLVNGDLVIGLFPDGAATITDPAVLQTVPTQQGVSMMILPFGYPFETEVGGSVEARHVLYVYQTFPEELRTRYMEAKSNLTLSTSGDLQNLDNLAQGAGGDISKLIR